MGGRGECEGREVVESGIHAYVYMYIHDKEIILVKKMTALYMNYQVYTQ